MHWLLFGILGAVVCAVGTLLLRQPGVLLYDWIATRAARPPAVPQHGSRGLAPQPVRSGGIAPGQALTGQ